jgi:hypothetical protein
MQFLRSQRFWKRLAIGAVLVIGVLLIANGIFAWRADRRLQRQVDLIRAEGAPASISELAPQPIPEAKNAAAIVLKLRPRIAAFADEQGKFYNTPIGKAYDEAGERGESPTAEQIAAIRAILDKYPDVSAGIAAAAGCNQYASQMNYSLNQRKFIEELIDNQSDVRQAARFLAWKMEVDLGEGKVEGAVEHGLQMMRLARLYDNEPSMICFLIGVAIRGIAMESLYDAITAGKVSEATHAALEAEIAMHDNHERLRRAIITERAMGAGWFDAVVEENTFRLFLPRLLGWPMKNYQTECLVMMTEQLKLADRPWHELNKQFKSGVPPETPSGHGVLADLLMPAIRASFQANARGIALLRSLRIYNALRQFSEKNGREATGLAELNLPAEVTIDPYSGKPLKLKHTDDGWTVYTVMENGVDDGGDFKELKDFGLAPRNRRSTK